MNSKYVDTTAIMQVIGTVYNDLSLLDLDDKYVITDDDFCNEFHKVVFGAIYKIHELGAKEVTLEVISDFLSTRPKALATYKQYKGEEWLIEISENCMPTAFDYYYNRLKKMTLLREFDAHGIDVSFIYDPDNILDAKKKQLQEDNLDNMALATIAQTVLDKVEDIKNKYVDNEFDEVKQAGEGIFELIDNLKENPEVGVPLYGPLINTITRGARLTKFYLRSAATGVGKSRSMVADACNIACDMIYDNVLGWIKNGSKEPTIFITTEQKIDEVQTMMLAFLSNVDEGHIIDNAYQGDEEERVRKAGQIIKDSPIYIDELPDFSLQDIENHIKKGIREHGIRYCFLDYIHSSIKILEEISQRTGGVKLREDNILFMMSIRLKDICNQYGIFIMSATQLNASYQDATEPDQNLLRGAKSIADKLDYGSILLDVTPEDLAKLDTIIRTNNFEYPSIKISVYKNRRGKYKGIYLWCKANLSTCRIEPMFCTGYDYILKEINNTIIQVSAF